MIAICHSIGVMGFEVQFGDSDVRCSGLGPRTTSRTLRTRQALAACSAPLQMSGSRFADRPAATQPTFCNTTHFGPLFHLQPRISAPLIMATLHAERLRAWADQGPLFIFVHHYSLLSRRPTSLLQARSTIIASLFLTKRLLNGRSSTFNPSVSYLIRLAA
jgi:hypothetical protein